MTRVSRKNIMRLSVVVAFCMILTLMASPLKLLGNLRRPTVPNWSSGSERHRYCNHRETVWNM